MNKLVCSVNGTHGKFSRSTRKHGRLGRMFVICGHCGQELQATSNGIFDTNPVKNKAESNKEKIISLRLTQADYYLWKSLDCSASFVFRIGLSNVIQ